MPDRPLIGVSACVRDMGGHPFHVAGEKYILAVAQGAEAVPVVVPALGGTLDPDAALERLDGLLLTGSPSNLEPAWYGGAPSDPGTLHDPRRDATTVPLIRRALARGVPLLAICRGFQELNVALGGTLHQKIHEVPGLDDHRADDARPAAEQYGPAHDVELTPGGLFERLAGSRRIKVNSLHGQGIDRLAEGLAVEATAPDGVIEAVRVREAPIFAVGVQWHPEWRFAENPVSRALFAAFGEAARAYRRQGAMR